jgi:hypothetical protein
MVYAVVFFLNAAANFALGVTLGALLGPAEFGRYATVALGASILAMTFFDWLRLSSIRFFRCGRASRGHRRQPRGELYRHDGCCGRRGRRASRAWRRLRHGRLAPPADAADRDRLCAQRRLLGADARAHKSSPMPRLLGSARRSASLW